MSSFHESRSLSDAAAELIRSRRTIHVFAEERPPHETVLEAIDLARWAPNHRLTEPWRFYLLGRKTAQAIAHLNAEMVTEARGEEAGYKKLERWLAIPGWLIVTCQISENAIRRHEDFLACACAVQNLQLYLWSEGIGTKWTTGAVTRDPRFYDLLGINAEAEALISMLWYGYPSEVPTTKRKSVTEVLTLLQ